MTEPTHEPAGELAELETVAAPAPVRVQRGSTWRRMFKWLALLWLGAAATAAALLVGILYFNLESTPLVGRLVRDQIVASLQERVDADMRVSINDVDIKRDGSDTVVDITDVRLTDTAGRDLFRADKGRITIMTGPLLGLKIVPTAVVLHGLNAEVELAGNGRIGVAPKDPLPSAAAPPAIARDAPIDAVKDAIGGAFSALVAFRQSIGGRLPDLGVEDATIRVLDRGANRQFNISGLTSRMRSQADGAAEARVSFRAGTVPVAVQLNLSQSGAQQQKISAHSTDLPLQALFAQFGIVTDAIDRDARATVRVEAAVDGAANPQGAQAELMFGKARLDLDRKMQPVPVDSARIKLHWTDGDARIAIDEIQGLSEGSVVRLTGEIVPPAAGQEAWRIAVRDAGTTIAPMTQSDTAIEFTTLEAQFSALPAQKTLIIDHLNVQGKGGRLGLTGRSYLGGDDRPGLELAVLVEDADVRPALRLWPAFAATEVRNWLAANARGGFVSRFDLKLSFSPDAFADAVADRPIPDAALAWSIVGSKATLAAISGAPPLQNGVFQGTGTGRTVSIDVPSATIELGQGRRIAVTDGNFSIADVSRKPADGRVRARFAGSIESALEFVRAPGLQPHVPKGVDALKASGNIEGDLTAQIRVAPKSTPGDAKIALSAKLKNLVLDQAIGGEKLEAGAFALNVDREGFSLKGDGKLWSTPAQIDVKGVPNSPAVASLTMTLDDATRARKGILPGSGITGPATLKVTSKLDGENEAVAVDIDITRVGLAGPVPGLLKKAGAPGRIRGVAREFDNGGWTVEKLELDAGTLQARGAMQFNKDGEFSKAQFSQLKLSGGDVMQVDVERGGSGAMKVNVRGNSIDVRPFLRSVQTGGIDKAGSKEVDLHLKSTVLSGFNGEVLANADIKMAMRASGLARFDLTGRFDGGPISAKVQQGARKLSSLNVVADDAGAFFRFVDLYNRMRGGHMELNAQLGASTQSGVLGVRNFALRDEPALKRLVVDHTTASTGTDSSRLQADLEGRLKRGQDVGFTRMTLNFGRTPGRLDIREGVLIGPEIGGNIEGRLDYARDTLNLTGTFVPAYSLNNALARVPVLGPIIAGGRNEGLFAVRYNINGRISAPELSINPLTVLAPGFLRKLIDFRGNNTSE